MSKEKEPQPLIQLSASSWSQEQKQAIARIAGQSLTTIEPIVHQTWGMQWWSQLLIYLELSQQDLGTFSLSFSLSLNMKEIDFQLTHFIYIYFSNRVSYKANIV